jgi:radical SAM protein with 4Fe4S-binding SPASM domain
LDVVYFEVTNSCNLSCIHCYANAGRRSAELGIREIFKLVDKLYDLGVLEIVLTGGEPLMRKDIFSIMEYITRKNMDFSIFTNSLLLDKDKIRRLKELNPRMVAVSLESSKSAVHDRIRGNGSFAKAIKNIRALVKAKLPVRINITLFRDLNDSSEQIESSLNYLRDMGVKQIAIGGLVSYGRGRLISSLIPELSAAERLAEAYKTFKTRIGRKSAPAIMFNDSFPKREREFDKHSICGIGTYSCAIRPNGDLGLCPVLQAKTRANALRGDLKDMWLHLKDFRDFREKTVDDIAMCRVCNKRYECLGGCKASSYMHNGRFDSSDPWMCSLFGVKQKS